MPHELETIVQKATAKEPGSRYLTAQELADDLRRFLELKPIRARRPTHWDRLVKWSRRHTALVASSLLMLSLAVVGLAACTGVIASKQAEIVRQRDLAQRHEQRARRTVDEMYTRLSERWLAQDPENAELRHEFLEKAASYYEQFARATATTRATRLEAAHAWLRAGGIGWTLRRTSDAVTALNRGIELFADLANDGHDVSLEAADGQVFALIQLGDVLFVGGRNSEARVLYSRAVDLARSIVERHPEHLAARLNLATAAADLGDLLDDTAALNEAEAILRSVLVDLIERQTDVTPIVEQLRNCRGVVFINNPRLVARAIESGADPRQAMLPQVYGSLAFTLGHLHRYQEAVDCAFARSASLIKIGMRGPTFCHALLRTCI